MVQYQENGKIVVHNLACRRVSGAHTADNIKTWFKDIIREFEIDEEQLLVFAIDSAANITKAAREYLSELEEKFAVDIMSENFDENGDVSDECVDIHTQVDYPDTEDGSQADEGTVPSELIASFPQDVIPTSFKIGCVAHQLQLAINKFSELPEISKLLEAARRLSAKLRTPTIKRRLDLEKLPYGIMDQITRWSSKARMTARLEQLHSFCLKNEELCVGLKAPTRF